MHTFFTLLSRFTADRRGNVLMLTGLTVLVLFAVGGAGVDFGRQQLVRLKLQGASDAAAVAAASLPSTVTAEERRNMAVRYFNLNYPATFLGVARPTPSIDVGDSVTVQASADVQANFVNNVGVPTLTSRGLSQVATNNASIGENYDIVLVMDNSGSMSADINGVFPDGSGGGGGGGEVIEPCGITVRCGRDIEGPQAHLWDILHGLLIASAYADETFVSKMDMLKEVTINMANGMLTSAGNRMGLISWDASVIKEQPLTSDREIIVAQLKEMSPRGGTNSTTGMQRAWEQRSSFDAKKTRAVVLLTDGLNNFAADDGSTIAICSNFKNSGFLVYTIAFGEVAENSTVKQFLTNCATPSTETTKYYYGAADKQGLQTAFGAIASSIRRMRITVTE